MGGSRTNSAVAGHLLIEIRRDSGVPLHRQVEAAIRDGVRAGRLPRGASMPPTRSLAVELGVSRGVVVEAYEQLVAEGYLSARTGGYTRVALGVATMPAGDATSSPPLHSAGAGEPPPTYRVDFGYGRADVSQFPRAAWLSSIRRVFNEAPNDRFGYLSGRGMPELRHALADYLNRVRGTSATADTVVVCNGYAQGIALVIAVLAASGARRLAVEDPSSGDDARPLAEAAGLRVVGVPVDADGVEVAALARSEADLAVLTPSHQWPTGGVLSAEARGAALRWAEQRGAVIVEDDYDAEYRYDRSPIGAMQGLAPDHVIYAGSASKTLAPGLRLGWLVVPRHLVDAVAEAKIAADRGSPAIEQLAFADFLDRGAFDRHLRRMRPVYRRRRDTLLAALRDRLPELEPAGVSAGMHLVAWLPAGLDETAVVRAAAARGLRISGVAPYRMSTDGPAARGGLILGYATLGERAIAEGTDLLADAVADVRSTG